MNEVENETNIEETSSNQFEETNPIVLTEPLTDESDTSCEISHLLVMRIFREVCENSRENISRTIFCCRIDACQELS